MGAGGTRSGFFPSYSEPHLWLFVSFSSGVRGVDVEQSPPALTPQEGASSTLWCNFSTSAVCGGILRSPGAATSFTFLQEQGKEED